MADKTNIESTLTIRWVFVIAIIIGIFGFFFTSVMSQENRITRVETTIETKFEAMGSDISDIKTGIGELRRMQIDQIKAGK